MEQINLGFKDRLIKRLSKINKISKNDKLWLDARKQPMWNTNTGEQIYACLTDEWLALIATDANKISVGDILIFGEGRLVISDCGGTDRGVTIFPIQRVENDVSCD